MPAPPPVTAPADHEDLIRLIDERYPDMSAAYQRIAVYLSQNPNEVAIETVSAIAKCCDVHPSSCVRFAQALGYRGFKELQLLFRRRLETAAPGFEARVRALEGDLLQHKSGSDLAFLGDLVVRDIASLQLLLEDVTQEDLATAAELIFRAPTVYLLGQLRSAPVALLLRYLLTMIGKRCVLLDASGGLATHSARTMGADDVLIAVSFRFYANEVVSIVDAARDAGQHIIAITDGTLSPLAKSVDVLFAVPERDYSFSRSLAAPMCLAQALVVAVAARVQKGTEHPRIPTVTRA